ncbi:MAG: HAMP domain-containing sensor histidine kinase [Planctomycetota bacterium]
MSAPTRGADVTSLHADNEQLRAQIERQRQELHVLGTELDETNKGVLALYAEIDDKAAQLHNASELKSRFLSYVSHEFRTPLAAIRSLSRLLLDRLDGPLTLDQDKQIRFVQASAVELSEMVDDLLDLAKVEAGRISVSPAWFDMVDLFAALRGMFKPILSTARVNLVFEEPIGVPRIYTDDRKLSQILRNFISNAIKFTEVGDVRVSARVGANATVVFAVTDIGIGISQADQAHLFQDFFQLDSIAQRKVRGTGLGLSLSRKMARLLGGEVSVLSELGKGSTFSVTIPIRFDHVAEQPPPPEAAVSASSLTQHTSSHDGAEATGDQEEA